MPMINGDVDQLTPEDAVTRVPSAWPLGRMVVAVFVICLVIWAVVIAYLTHL